MKAQKLSWIWTSSDTKIVKNFKRICKNLHILNFPNKEDDLILETNASNDHGSKIFKIKEEETLSKYCNGSLNKAKYNYHTKDIRAWMARLKINLMKTNNSLSEEVLPCGCLLYTSPSPRD